MEKRKEVGMFQAKTAGGSNGKSHRVGEVPRAKKTVGTAK